MGFRIAWLESMSDVDRTAWDELATPLATPFLEWDWLHQLEASGSISPKTGWVPRHLTVWSGNRLAAAAPLYIKHHSSGEFVFDYAWADLAHRIGAGYYPKLVGMSPFTPVPAYRFLIAPSENSARIEETILDEIHRFCRRRRISGCSFLYIDPEWRKRMAHFGFSTWMHQSYQWENHGYRNFEEYLSTFNANQRHNIRRERKKIEKMGLRIHAYSHDAIPKDFLPLVYRYYERTNDKFGPWGCKFLSPAFFDGIYRQFRHRLLLVGAFRENGEKLPVGMALLLHKGDQLYGRYWGSSFDIRMLHFNACYYAPIEWAIENGIRRFDPGIGSNHKTRRGFVAVPNYSLHRFYDLRMQHILETHIEEINQAEWEYIRELNDAIPHAKAADRVAGQTSL
jgi:predicted N-acyltransferase